MADIAVFGVEILSDVKQFTKYLTEIESKQLPYAFMLTINSLADDAQAKVKAELHHKFTLRTGWVKKGIRVHHAKKDNLRARVYTMDWLMGYMESGGRRWANNSEYIWVPTLDARVGGSFSGKIRKRMKPGSIQKQMAEKRKRRKKPGRGRYASLKPFMMTASNGHKMVVIRDSKSERLPVTKLYTLSKSVNVDPRWGMGKTIDLFVVKHFRNRLFFNLKKALETSRTGPKRSGYVDYMVGQGPKPFDRGPTSEDMKKVPVGLPSYSGAFN